MGRRDERGGEGSEEKAGVGGCEEGWGWGERRNCQTGEISRSGNDWPFPDRASVKYHRPRTSPSPIPGPPRPLFILAPLLPHPSSPPSSSNDRQHPQPTQDRRPRLPLCWLVPTPLSTRLNIPLTVRTRPLHPGSQESRHLSYSSSRTTSSSPTIPPSRASSQRPSTTRA